MPEKRGKLIVIEGTDRSGKATQVNSLKIKAEREGIYFDVFSFPRYLTPEGEAIRRYLDGFFGNPIKLSPKFSAHLYAMDRFAAKHQLLDYSINQGRNVLCDRYAGSNPAHQGAKLPKEKRQEFVKWCEDYEFNILGIPKPDLTICLHVPIEEVIKAMENQQRIRDEHEANLDYQQKVIETYLWLATTKTDWVLIDCMNSGERKSIEEVTEEIWLRIKPILAS